MAIGIQQFAVASLPRFLRIMVGMFGVGGTKEKGLDLLRNAAEHGVVTTVESRTALSLFLRHDGRYPEALQVERSLTQQYPHDYLFALEVANLLKDEGHGYEAIAAYKQVLADAQQPGYFIDPRLQLAWFGLAETQRGYNQLQDAVNSYIQAAEQPNCSDWLRRRAQVNAGEVYDILHRRAEAMKMYQMAATGSDNSQARSRAQVPAELPTSANSSALTTEPLSSAFVSHDVVLRRQRWFARLAVLAFRMDARFCSGCGRPMMIESTSPFRTHLVRPREGRVIAGVCAGFAQAYGWDPDHRAPRALPHRALRRRNSHHRLRDRMDRHAQRAL